MYFYKYKHIIYLLFVVVVSLFWACSPKFSHDVKSFLFDGVPDPYKVEISAINDSLKLDSTSIKGVFRNPIIRNEFNQHPPYKKRECESCHDRGQMSKSKLPSPELCYQCHDDFNKTYEFLHGPIAAGNCTQCHNPHQSKLKNLLLKKSQDLCFNCHDSKKIIVNKIHEKIKDESCTTCHNPHGGSNIYSLQSGSCYQCHDNYKMEYKFLHAPVASNNCSECHTSHKNTTPKLLVYSSNKLCFNCHDSKEIYTTEYHQKIKKENCTKCHNPHGGSNKNFVLISKQ